MCGWDVVQLGFCDCISFPVYICPLILVPAEGENLTVYVMTGEAIRFCLGCHGCFVGIGKCRTLCETMS